jgi:mRNA degradation ribonuclease J1/J2
MVKDTSRQEDNKERDSNKYDRPVDIHGISPRKVEPHKEAHQAKEEGRNLPAMLEPQIFVVRHGAYL